MDSQNAISYRNFASSMGDTRLLTKIDCYIQEHLLEISEQEDFLKLPRLKVSFSTTPVFSGNVFMHLKYLRHVFQLEVMLEDHLSLPSNGKLYSKVISWVQRSLWENGEPLERLMEEVCTAFLFELSLSYSFSLVPPTSNHRFSVRESVHTAQTHPAGLMGFFFLILYSIFCSPSPFASQTIPFSSPSPLPQVI